MKTDNFGYGPDIRHLLDAKRLTRRFHRQALRSRKTVENRQAATVAYEEIP
jgi:hypothetical protein